MCGLFEQQNIGHTCFRIYVLSPSQMSAVKVTTSHLLSALSNTPNVDWRWCGWCRSICVCGCESDTLTVENFTLLMGKIRGGRNKSSHHLAIMLCTPADLQWHIQPHSLQPPSHSPIIFWSSPHRILPILKRLNGTRQICALCFSFSSSSSFALCACMCVERKI